MRVILLAHTAVAGKTTQKSDVGELGSFRSALPSEAFGQHLLVDVSERLRFSACLIAAPSANVLQRIALTDTEREDFVKPEEKRWEEDKAQFALKSILSSRSARRSVDCFAQDTQCLCELSSP